MGKWWHNLLFDPTIAGTDHSAICQSIGDVTGLLTRNVYGALVLNTARMMFVDVDLPSSDNARTGLFSGYLGKKRMRRNRTIVKFPLSRGRKQWARETSSVELARLPNESGAALPCHASSFRRRRADRRTNF
jgi:hypothetical protein